MKKFFCYLLIIFIQSTTLWAQNITEQTLINLTNSNKELDTFIKKLNNGITREETTDILNNITPLRELLIKNKQYYLNEQENVQKKIDVLGENNNNEAVTISKQRKEFNILFDKNKTKIIEIDIQIAKIEEIHNLILKTRNQQLLNNILVKQSSIFHPKEFINSLKTFSIFIYETIKSPYIWYKKLTLEQKNIINEKIKVTIITIIIISILSFLIQYILQNLLSDKNNNQPLSYTKKIKNSLFLFLKKGITPISFLFTLYYMLHNITLINNPPFKNFLNSAISYAIYYYLIKSSIIAILTPNNEDWRLFKIDNNKAQNISTTIIISSLVICIASFFQNIANTIEYDNNIIYALKIFTNGLKVFCVILISRRILYNNKTLTDEEIQDDTSITELNASSKISILIITLMISSFTISLLGYIRLSEFIINRFIMSIILIIAVYIIKNLISAIIHQILLFKFWINIFRINRRSLIKLEFWLNLLVSPIIWLSFIFVILALWGASVDLMFNKLKNILIGFNIGGMHISITSILLGIFSFFVLLSFFKIIKSSFTDGNLSKIEMNDGLKNSVVSSINFLGFIFSGIFAIAIMGGSLSNIALIAGALSFGIGLGLQNMVSNLAAGLTILWARPIKIGDWVNINGFEGIVKQINMRSTEIRSWDKSTIIIPNSDILSKSLVNYTYNGRFGRIVLPVSINYNNDIEKIKNILYEISTSNIKILNSPTPTIEFNGIKDYQLIFQIICYTDNILNRGAIINELKESIIKNFQKQNIFVLSI